MGDLSFKNANTLLKRVLDLDYFVPNDKGVTPIVHHRIKGQDPLVVVTGDNASGKSFIRRLVSAIARKNSVESIHISMEGRSGADMTGGMRAFVYGSEEWRSTGENSANTVITGIRTCQGREKPHVMFWDEPDLGLSDSWAAGVGVSIRKFAEDAPKHTKAIFVVTHSKPLVAQLIPFDPHFLYLGEDPPKSLTDWLERPVIPRDIEELGKISHKRFLLIQAILDRVQKAKERD